MFFSFHDHKSHLIYLPTLHHRWFNLQGLLGLSLPGTHVLLPQQSQAKLAGSSGCAYLGAREPASHFVPNLQLRLLAESHSTSCKLKIAALSFGKELLFKGLL